MLSCGGVVFVLSDEEVTFAAMRHGWDDLMAFMNVVSRGQKPESGIVLLTPRSGAFRRLLSFAWCSPGC